MKTIESLSTNKENDSSHGNINISKLWKYCYLYRVNKSHDSTHCTSKYKYAVHKDEATFKDTKGRSTRNFKIRTI